MLYWKAEIPPLQKTLVTIQDIEQSTHKTSVFLRVNSGLYWAEIEMFHKNLVTSGL